MSTSTTKQVIVFKAPSDVEKEKGDAYTEVLSSGGFQVVNIPVLDFEFINLDRLLTKLKRSDDYSGIIFSSPRCVKVCTLAADIGILEQWKSHRNFAVGETTGKIARDIGLGVAGMEAGNANALVDIIRKDEYTKPFLYPIGSLTNNEFKEKLKSISVEVDDIVVYKTKPHDNLKANIKSLSDKLIKPAYFLYFSPSGVNFTLPILKELNFNLRNVKFAAIGPTTEKCLKENGLEVFRTVGRPTPTAALEALTAGS